MANSRRDHGFKCSFLDSLEPGRADARRARVLPRRRRVLPGRAGETHGRAEIRHVRAVPALLAQSVLLARAWRTRQARVALHTEPLYVVCQAYLGSILCVQRKEPLDFREQRMEPPAAAAHPRGLALKACPARCPAGGSAEQARSACVTGRTLCCSCGTRDVVHRTGCARVLVSRGCRARSTLCIGARKHGVVRVECHGLKPRQRGTGRAVEKEIPASVDAHSQRSVRARRGEPRTRRLASVGLSDKGCGALKVARGRVLGAPEHEATDDLGAWQHSIRAGHLRQEQGGVRGRCVTAVALREVVPHQARLRKLGRRCFRHIHHEIVPRPVAQHGRHIGQRHGARQRERHVAEVHCLLWRAPVQMDQRRLFLQGLQTLDEREWSSLRTTTWRCDGVDLHNRRLVTQERALSAPQVEIRSACPQDETLGHASMSQTSEVRRPGPRDCHAAGIHEVGRGKRADVRMQPSASQGERLVLTVEIATPWSVGLFVIIGTK